MIRAAENLNLDTAIYYKHLEVQVEEHKKNDKQLKAQAIATRRAAAAAKATRNQFPDIDLEPRQLISKDPLGNKRVTEQWWETTRPFRLEKSTVTYAEVQREAALRAGIADPKQMYGAWARDDDDDDNDDDDDGVNTAIDCC